jgi:ketosteroid isomerase-like protein
MENQANMENQDRRAVEKVLTCYFNALNESDVKTAVNSYTADGVFMAAGAPTALW